MVAKPASPEALIQDLIHNAKASGGRLCERRLADLTIWFYRNKNTMIDTDKRTKFLETAVWILIEQQALLLEILHNMEAKRPGASLFLPSGMIHEESGQRFG